VGKARKRVPTSLRAEEAVGNPSLCPPYEPASSQPASASRWPRIPQSTRRKQERRAGQMSACAAPMKYETSLEQERADELRHALHARVAPCNCLVDSGATSRVSATGVRARDAPHDITECRSRTAVRSALPRLQADGAAAQSEQKRATPRRVRARSGRWRAPHHHGADATIARVSPTVLNPSP